MVVVWKIIALVSSVPAVFQCWGEGLRWWAEGAEVFQLLWPKYDVGFFLIGEVAGVFVGRMVL